MNKELIRVAIDGPSGAGKSTLARKIAQDLSIIYVDTGAMYRAIGLYVHRQGKNTQDPAQVLPCLEDIRITTAYTPEQGQCIFLNGEDVSVEIRAPEIAMAASHVSAIPAVRTFLLRLQQEMAEQQSLIMDGRDIGTVILPNADLKVFLTATPQARAKRRWQEYRDKGQESRLEEVLADVERRDAQDTNRTAAPLSLAKDAVLLDTTDLDFNQSVAAVKVLIENCIQGRVKDVL